jgi:hypothetical protein
VQQKENWHQVTYGGAIVEEGGAGIVDDGMIRDDDGLGVDEGGGTTLEEEDVGGGGTLVEEGGGGVTFVEEGGGGITLDEEGGGGVTFVEEGGGGITLDEEGGGFEFVSIKSMQSMKVNYLDCRSWGSTSRARYNRWRIQSCVHSGLCRESFPAGRSHCLSGSSSLKNAAAEQQCFCGMSNERIEATIGDCELLAERSTRYVSYIDWRDRSGEM